MPPSNVIPKSNKTRVLLLALFGGTALVMAIIFLWWTKSVNPEMFGRASAGVVAEQAGLPEALQPQEPEAIDNSDILASASGALFPEADSANQDQDQDQGRNQAQAQDQAQDQDQEPTLLINRLTLLIRNRSSAVDPADIKVTLDGRVIVNEGFKYGSMINVGDGAAVPVPGLDWKQLPLKLAVGKHQIKAESVNGQAMFEAGFTVTDKEWWASLEYVDGQKFDWQLSELPIIPL